MVTVSSIAIPMRWRKSGLDSEDSLDRLVFSILDDAVSTNGWTKRRGRLYPPKATTTNDRIVVAKKILTQRMLEQFENQETKSRFKDEFDALKHNLVDPMDIPSEAEGIAEMFSNVTIHPVLEKAEKRLYRFLRHSRLPFNTTLAELCRSL